MQPQARPRGGFCVADHVHPSGNAARVPPRRRTAFEGCGGGASLDSFQSGQGDCRSLESLEKRRFPFASGAGLKYRKGVLTCEPAFIP